MIRKTLASFFITICFLTGTLWMPLSAKAESKAFAYVSNNYIITAEVAGERAFILNFINMSDYVLVMQPSEFIYRGSSGRCYIGQVFEKEHKDLRGEEQIYTASIMLKGHSFTGLNIVGAFHEQEKIEEISLRIGTKRFYLRALDKTSFDQLAKKISSLDLEDMDSAVMLQAANISEIGSFKNADGTSEWDRDWQSLITPEGINPPKILKRPEIAPTVEAVKTHNYGTVKLAGIINKNGGIQDLKVVRGLGRELDERAMEGVKNSWIFLPATKNGEVVETQIPIEIDFRDPDKK
jgi:TonB family protein